jgi:cyclophilin family peptidyl-prolyl cis-trans isomerase
MARGPAPGSATTQFFFNLRDNTLLDYPSVDGYGYAVFGRVVAGMDVVDRIVALETAPVEVYNASGELLGIHPHAPVTPVTIENTRILP